MELKIKDQLTAFAIIDVALFPILPFISIILMILLIINQRSIGNKVFQTVFLMLSVFLGLINMTKIPESDLKNYYEIYTEAGNMPFINYIFLTGKEPAFFIYNYIVYHLASINVQHYILITTVISYMFIFNSIYKLTNLYTDNCNIILFAISLAAFFPQLFSLSAHLIRQFMAASIIMYAIILKVFYNRRIWYYLIIAAFIHTTVLFFVPLIFINLLKDKIKLKTFFKLSIALVLIIAFITLIFSKIVSTLTYNPFLYALSYSLLRMNEVSEYKAELIPLIGYILIVFLFIILVRTQYNITLWRSIETRQGLIHFANIFFIFSIFILTNFMNDEMAIRYFFYAYFFFPLIFPLILLRNSLVYRMTRFYISLFIIVFFFFKIQNGAWSYAPIKNILFRDIFYFTTYQIS